MSVFLVIFWQMQTAPPPPCVALFFTFHSYLIFFSNHVAIILVFFLFSTPNWLHSSSLTSPKSSIKPTQMPRKAAATARHIGIPAPRRLKRVTVTGIWEAEFFFQDILNRWKTDPYVHPVFCPERTRRMQRSVLWRRGWLLNAAFIDSFGRKKSLHVKSSTAATHSLMGAKYHPERLKVPPNWYVAAAPWLRAETVPTGSRNKVKLKIMWESLIRVKWL